MILDHLLPILIGVILLFVFAALLLYRADKAKWPSARAAFAESDAGHYVSGKAYWEWVKRALYLPRFSGLTDEMRVHNRSVVQAMIRSPYLLHETEYKILQLWAAKALAPPKGFLQDIEAAKILADALLPLPVSLALQVGGALGAQPDEAELRKLLARIIDARIGESSTVASVVPPVPGEVVPPLP